MRFPQANLEPLNELDRFYPVGSIYVSILPTNPAITFGFGTWAAIGAGRAIVGVNPADADFDAPEKLSGAKTITLTESQIPAHTHTQDSHNHTQNAHTHTQNSHNHTQDAHTHIQNAHNHVENLPSIATGGLVGCTPDASTNTSVASGFSTANATAVNQNATAINQAATAVNQNATPTNQAATAVNQNTGGGAAHNNVQPSIALFLWKRVS